MVLVEVQIIIFVVIKLLEAESCERGRFDRVLIVVDPLDNLVFETVVDGCIIQIVLQFDINSEPNKILLMHDIMLHELLIFQIDEAVLLATKISVDPQVL